MLEYKNGDLVLAFINNDIDILVHGCNCYNKMGKGLAKQVRQEFPCAYQADTEYSKTVERNNLKLGSYSFCEPYKNRFIINAYTQETYWNPERMLDYNAVRKVFTKIDKDFPTQKIGIPFIGCGLAQGSWDIISNILENIFVERTIYVYHQN